MVILQSTKCVPVNYQAASNDAPVKILQYTNTVYENEIRTVQLFPSFGTDLTHLLTPAVPLHENNPLTLEFDDLTNSPFNYFATIKHCNANWTPSSLRDMDYMKEYNEFRISKYDLSLNTKVNYVHYTFQLPEVTIPGNYLLVVYRDPYKDDYILSRRFVVYDNSAPISIPDPHMGMSQVNGHTINFDVHYGSLGITDPLNELTATIIQNGRWDNAIENLRPTFIRENKNMVEFRFFDHTNRFAPGNEYRYFDIRSIISPGVNVRSIEREASPVKMGLMEDKPRTGLAYSFHRDINGSYQTLNFDADNTTRYSDYLKVKFTLQTEYLQTGNIYLFGALTDWQTRIENKMVYGEAENVGRKT